MSTELTRNLKSINMAFIFIWTIKARCTVLFHWKEADDMNVFNLVNYQMSSLRAVKTNFNFHIMLIGTEYIAKTKQYRKVYSS